MKRWIVRAQALVFLMAVVVGLASGLATGQDEQL